MKKNLVLIFLLLLTIGWSSKAQLRHIEGFKAVGLNGGAVNNGYTISATYYHYLASRQILKAELAYEHVSFNYTPWNVFYVEPQYLYTAWKYKSWYFLDLKAGLLLGLENGKNDILNDKKTNFFIGEDFGLENEFFINDNISFSLSFSQRFIQKSDLGSLSWVVKSGINYNF